MRFTDLIQDGWQFKERLSTTTSIYEKDGELQAFSFDGVRIEPQLWLNLWKV